MHHIWGFVLGPLLSRRPFNVTLSRRRLCFFLFALWWLLGENSRWGLGRLVRTLFLLLLDLDFLLLELILVVWNVPWNIRTGVNLVLLPRWCVFPVAVCFILVYLPSLRNLLLVAVDLFIAAVTARAGG